jgi:hypothetical protein
MYNILIGAGIGLAYLLLKGDSDNEGKHEISSNRADSGGPGAEHHHDKKRHRSSDTLTKRENIKLKTARLNYLTQKLKRGQLKALITIAVVVVAGKLSETVPALSFLKTGFGGL